MEHSIYKYILRHSMRQQVILTIMAFLSFPFLYYYLELPKIIIDQAIQAKEISFPVEIMGFELGQKDFLYLTVGAFLALVVINQGFKYVINVYRGLTGERMLRRLRYDLFSRILRFPLPTFKKKSPGEIIPMVTAEVEPLGGFIGEAFSLPAFQGGYLLVIMSFLVIQNWIMALAAISLYPLQAYFIPKLQRRVNLLGKERVKRVRKLSDMIGESVSGVQEIHAHDMSNYTRANFAHELDGIFDVRYRIYVQKFVIKFLNNFIQQLGPFFFFALGGTMVINGNMEIGTLVAAISAHKEMAAPWKELLGYYQRREDARIKYEQVVEQFEPAGMRPAEYQTEEPEQVPKLNGELAVSNVTMADDQGTSLLDGLNVKLDLDQRIAMIGPAGSGREAASMVLARLLDPDRGTIKTAEVDFSDASEAVTGRRISYIGPHGYVFNASLGDNLFFGLKHRPLTEPDYNEEELAIRKAYVSEADLTGNSSENIKANWIDYAAAQVSNDQELSDRAIDILEKVGLANDVYQFGLRSSIDPKENQQIAENILNARHEFTRRVEADPDLRNLIEGFDREQYNTNASLAENLLFGTPVGDAFDLDRMAENTYVLKIIQEAQLTETFLKVGYQVASLMVELFADLDPDHEFFQLYGFISSDDLQDYQSLLGRIDSDHLEELKEEDRLRFLSLPFKVITSRHRLGVLSPEIQEKIVAARTAFADNLPPELTNSVAFFDADAYNAAANLQDNILFGKVAFGYAQAAEKVGAVLAQVVDELQLKDSIMQVGLQFDVGNAGARLSANQRQKLCIARAILKRPDILIINQATAAFDSQSQQQIMENILNEFEDRCVIWSLDNADSTAIFDQILVMSGGKVVESGDYEKLNIEGSLFRELLSTN